MSTHPVPLVRCLLDGEDEVERVRYVPAAEFELWRYFMETRHSRSVTVDEVSVWVPETPSVLADGIDADALQPVVRIRFAKPGPEGTAIPVERFLPAECSTEVKSALLSHFDPRCRWSLEATPGYFMPVRAGRRRSHT